MISEERIINIENMMKQILAAVIAPNNRVTDKWLSETQVKETLFVGADTLYNLRRKNILRASSATGRKLKYFRTDVEQYLLDHSSITRKEYNKVDKVQKITIPTELLGERWNKTKMN